MNRKHPKAILLSVMILMGAGCIGPIKDISYQPSSLITIRDSLKYIRCALYLGDKPVIPKNGKRYYWCEANRIHSTVGDYSGRLLNGVYLAFDNEGELIEKGSFDRGLKKGAWVSWCRTGEVLYYVKHRNGKARDTTWSKLIKKQIYIKDTAVINPKKVIKEKATKKKKNEK